MYIDAHAHLDDPILAPREEEILAAAKAAGVGVIVNASSDLPSSEKSVALAKRHVEVYAVIGVHPHEAKTYSDEVEKKLKGIGKTGQEPVKAPSVKAAEKPRRKKSGGNKYYDSW